MRIGPSLSLSASRGGGFSPSRLFAGGERGLWYDPSDISTMFQDIAGSVPVTAAGQPVGMILDKSRGLVLGPELFTGQTAIFDNAAGGATASFNNATRTLSVTAVGVDDSYPRVRYDLGMVPGRTYLVEGRIDGVRTGVQLIRLALSGTANNLAYNSTTGVFSGRMAAAVSTIEFAFNGTISGDRTIAALSVRELPGDRAVQASAGSRPLYQVDGSGRGYLVFDGVDDSLVTGIVTPGSDKVQIFAGLRRMSDAGDGCFIEINTFGANGTFILFAPSGINSYVFRSIGTLTSASVTGSGFPAPDQAVITCIGDIAADTNIIRRNGVQVGSSASDQGTGNYLPQQIFIGRRNQSSIPFNGRLYSLITRFGSNLSADQIAATENWVNARTGAF